MLYKGTQPICPIITVESNPPVVDTLTVTPSTTTQTITPPSGTDGYNTIKVSAVTSAIDSDIVASNIKSGVNILGVSGTVTELVGQTMTVDITSTDTTSSIINVFTPSSGYNGIKKIKVRPTLKPLTIIPTTTTQTFSVPSGYSGFGAVTCSAETIPTLITKTITTNGTYNASSDNADGYSSVSVNVAGTVPTGTYTITANGTYDVTNYASADVSVSGGGGTGITREVSANGVYQMPTSNFTFTLPNTATDVGERALYYIFYNCPTQMSVDLSSLTKVSTTYAMNSAFRGCTGLTSIDLSNLSIVEGQYSMQHLCNGCTGLTGILNLSSLITISGIQALQNAFQGCTGVTNVNLSSLTTVTASSAMASSFLGCTSLTSVDLSSLTTIGTSGVNSGQFTSCFNNCNALTSLSFPNLEKIYCTGSQSTTGTFSGNNKIQKMYFPKLDTITYATGSSASNQTGAKNVFYNCSALTELHFGSANQSAIQASPGYSTAWGRGAGNVTIYFDL